MSTNILFITEGERTEQIIIKSINKHLLHKSIIVTCAYAAEIYQLYREIVADPDLDMFNLIKDRNDINRKRLNGYQRKDFAEIYLFFDYDAHSSLAGEITQFGRHVKPGDEKLLEMLKAFDNETDKGKLYLSYPMVESLRHIIDYSNFYKLTVKCKGVNCVYKDSCSDTEYCNLEPKYKSIVTSQSIPQLSNINSYTNELWGKIILAHLCKMNYIVNSTNKFPQKLESQSDIFTKQLEKYINKKCPKVSVLSAFPIFIHDYYGNKKTMVLISYVNNFSEI